MRTRLSVLLAPLAVVALVLSPASASTASACEGTDGALELDERQVWIQEAETKAGNLAAVGATGFPTWGDEAPAASVTEGAGGGYLANSYNFVAENNEEIFGLTVEGAFSGCLDTMLVDLYAFLPTNRTGTGGELNESPFDGVITLDIDGVRVLYPSEIETNTVENPDGDATYLIRFAITGIHDGMVFEGLEPGGDHTLTLKVNPRYVNTNNALFVYNTTEVPAGVQFNGVPGEHYPAAEVY